MRWQRMIDWVTRKAWCITALLGVLMALGLALAIVEWRAERYEGALRLFTADLVGYVMLTLLHVVARLYLNRRLEEVAQLEFETDHLEIGVFRHRSEKIELRGLKLLRLPEEPLEYIALRQPKHHEGVFNYAQTLDWLETRHKFAAERRKKIDQAHREINFILYGRAAPYPSPKEGVH